MIELLPVIKRLIVLGLWVYIGFVIVPAANRSGRSGVLWYFAGLASFYLPLVLIYAGGAAIVLPARHRFELSGDAVRIAMMAVWALAGFAAFICLHRLRLYLQRNPKNA